jgi:hypothetical protein
MKYLFLYTFLVLSILNVNSQSDINPSEKNDNQITNSAQYRLFPTQNIWNFIKLDTRSGLMWQVQFSLNNEGRLVSSLNQLPLVLKDQEVNDRFTLYPTQNMYNFILLDQINGKTWQVQWSTTSENRMVVPIE